jgi:hypothetical protein
MNTYTRVYESVHTGYIKDTSSARWVLKVEISLNHTIVYNIILHWYPNQLNMLFKNIDYNCYVGSLNMQICVFHYLCCITFINSLVFIGLLFNDYGLGLAKWVYKILAELCYHFYCKGVYLIQAFIYLVRQITFTMHFKGVLECTGSYMSRLGCNALFIQLCYFIPCAIQF